MLIVKYIVPNFRLITPLLFLQTTHLCTPDDTLFHLFVCDLKINARKLHTFLCDFLLLLNIVWRFICIDARSCVSFVFILSGILAGEYGYFLIDLGIEKFFCLNFQMCTVFSIIYLPLISKLISL